MSFPNDRLLKLLDITTPIVCAPMATAAGGMLAAEVTLAGGFGFIGAALYTIDQLEQEIDIARQKLGTGANSCVRIGVGFLGCFLDQNEQAAERALKVTLDRGVIAIWFAFGNDLIKWIQVVRKYDATTGRRTLIFVQLALTDQVQSAIQEWDVDVIVAQGNEAGGHGFSAAPPLKTILKSVLSITPVEGPVILGAGGLATGKQIAEVLSLGAAGVVLGTRFCLTPESVYSDAAKRALLVADSNASVKSMGFDLVAEYLIWPKGIDGRALRNASLDGYETGEDLELLRSKYKEAYPRDDTTRTMVWAGAGVGLMNEIKPAKEVVKELDNECQAHLRATGSMALVN